MAAPKGNKYAIGADSGRPPVFETVEALTTKASDYFSKTAKSKWTITGLALYLGFSDRQSLYDYQKKEEFSGVIKYCRTMVEMAYEEKLNTKGVTGAIFALKNMGWKDKAEMDIRTPEGVTVLYKQQVGNQPLPDDD